jgi:uncharacterized protein YjbJ (UPF0337 family)
MDGRESIRCAALVNEVRAAGQKLTRSHAERQGRFAPAVSAEGMLSFLNKIKNRSQVTRGRAKQKAGRATKNRRLRAEGLADRVGGNAKQFGQDLKDDVRRTFKR